MNAGFLFASLLALLCGFLAQQTVEALVNTCLVFLPFKVQTVR
jgi:hypothetical protein